MNHKFFRKFFSFFLSLLLLFQGSVSYLIAFAQESTDSTPSAEIIVEPSPTPDPTPLDSPGVSPSPSPEPTPISDWIKIDDSTDKTSEKIAEGKTYNFRNTQVSVKFTKITQPGFLKIQEVKVGKDTGYDITSDMPDGTFAYDLTLPNPHPDQVTRIQYSEDGQTYQDLPSLKNLDHFTIFVVRTDTPDDTGNNSTSDSGGGTVCVFGIGETSICYKTIQAAIDAASAGDEIHIGSGTYTDTVIIDKPLTLACQSNTDTIINAGSSNIGISLISGADNVTIKNCKITGNGDGINADSVSNLTLQNLIVDNNSFSISGVYASDVTGLNISGSTFSNNIIGLDLVGTTSGVTVSTSTFTNNSAYHISNDTSNDVTATSGNSWGTLDGDAINTLLYDKKDLGTLGRVIFDATNPTVDAGVDKVTNTSFTQNATASDTYGIASYFWEKVSGPGTVSFNNTAIEDPNISANSDGVYSIKLTVTDTSGNTDSDTFQLTWDATFPSISFDSPANKSILRSTVSLQASGSDAGGSGLNPLMFSYQKSGESEFTEIGTDSQSPYALFWNTTTVTDGDYVLRVAASDGAGNISWSDINVTIDNTKPVSSVTSPAYDNSGTIPVTFTSSDNLSGVASVDLWYRFNGGTWTNYGVTSNFDPTEVNGTYEFYSIATDMAGNIELAPASADSSTIFDHTNPTAGWDSPAADSSISGTVTLQVSASDSPAGIASILFQYKRNDGTDSFHDTPALWDTTSLPLDNYTIRAIVTDNAGNSTTIDRTVGVAAIITGQSSSTTSTNSFTVTWTTDRPTSGRIVYDTVSHPVLGAAPNYSYAFSTGTIDTSPETTSHTITVSGLSDNTIYYWRMVSAGSPTVVSDEYQNKTFSVAGAGTSTSTPLALVLGAAAQPQYFAAATPVEEVLGLSTEPSPTPAGTLLPSPLPEVQGASTSNFNWWWVFIPMALLGLVISGLLFRRRS